MRHLFFKKLVKWCSQYITRAKAKIYVHVLSPNYILRDFMKSKQETMKYDRKYIAKFVPEYVKSRRNVYLHLLRKLLKENISRKEIYDSIKTCEEPVEFVTDSYKNFDAWNAIKEIVHDITNITIRPEIDIQTTTYRAFSEKEENMIQDFSYRIISKNVRHSFHKYFQQASYINESGEKCHINQLILAGHLLLKYLPGEYVTLNGKYYQVEKILYSNEETFLIVKRASEQITGRCYYRQLREYNLGAEQKQGSRNFVFRENGVSLERLVMDFEAKTIGYLTIHGHWNNFGNMQEKIFDDLQMEYTRKYFKKQLLRVNLPEEKITRSEMLYLAAVIYEMFCTLYPQYCYLLSVAVYWTEENDTEQMRYRGVLSKLKLYQNEMNYIQVKTEKNEDDNNMKKLTSYENSFYIIEDSYEDIGLLRSIERNFQRILQLAAEYIEWADNKFSYFPK